MWDELGHPSPCIFGTLQGTKVSNFGIGHSRGKASPNRPGLHGEVAGEVPKAVSAVDTARERAKVSGQPGAPAIAANGESSLAIAAPQCIAHPDPECMAHPESGCPPHPLQDSLLLTISRWEAIWGNTPLRLRLLQCLPWWKRNAPSLVVQLILRGVEQDIPLPPSLTMSRPNKSEKDLQLAQEILLDYEKSGAVRVVTDPHHTRHLVPWFIVSKEEQGGLKHRFITDCRELNQFFAA